MGMAIKGPEHAEQAASGDHRDDGDGPRHRDGLLHDPRRDEVGLELEVGEVADGEDKRRLPAGVSATMVTGNPAIMPPTSGMKASRATTKASSVANGTPIIDITMKAKVAFSRADGGLADHVVAHRAGDFLGQGIYPRPA